MTELTVSASVTAIGEGAFKNGNRLQKITFGENIETIADSAFAHCPYLLEIHAQMEFPPLIDASVFADCGDLSGIDCYVPQASFAFYKKTAVWKELNLIVSTVTDLDDVKRNGTNCSQDAQKVMVNDQVLILLPDGRHYNVLGTEVK